VAGAEQEPQSLAACRRARLTAAWRDATQVDAPLDGFPSLQAGDGPLIGYRSTHTPWTKPRCSWPATGFRTGD